MVTDITVIVINKIKTVSAVGMRICWDLYEFSWRHLKMQNGAVEYLHIWKYAKKRKKNRVKKCRHLDKLYGQYTLLIQQAVTKLRFKKV